MKIKGAPDKPGLYWAKSRESMEWWDLIVEVAGEAPYLEVIGIADRKTELKGVEPYEIGMPCYPPATRVEIYKEDKDETDAKTSRMAIRPICSVCGKTFEVAWHYKGKNYCNEHAPPEMHKTG